MRILMVSDTYYPTVGGAQVHVAELTRHLRDKGHRIRLFTTEAGPDDDTSIVRLPWKHNFFEVFQALWRMTGEDRPDVIGAHFSYRLAAIAGVVAMLRRIPMTVTLHGLGTLPEPHATTKARVQVWIYRLVSLWRADHVIATSQDMLDAVPWVAHKTTIVPNGADANQFNPATVAAVPTDGRPTILTVRRLNPKNGIQYLVEAMPYIVKRHPQVRYLMVGTGHLEVDIRARIKALGLERNVEMVGLVQNPDVPKWFAASDVVVFPSTAESTSISCIEAMLMAKPVVASAVGGLIELIGRDGSRGKLVKIVDWEHSDYEAPDTSAIPPERYVALADAISALLDDQATRIRIGQAAHDYALENFTWQVVTERTVEIFNHVRLAVLADKS